MSNKLVKDFVRGFLNLHILRDASKEEIYGKEFKEVLKKHGYNISYGTLYPIFHKLERKGLLKSKKRIINGKTRKYYQTTSLGKKELDAAMIKASELFKDLNPDNNAPDIEQSSGL